MKRVLKNQAITAMTVLALLTSTGGPIGGSVAHANQPGRPPQFVMLAFDGSLSLPFWQNSRQFAREMKQQGKTVKFTYFLSGVYFLASANKMEYDAPHHGKGKSAIGFGGAASELPKRVVQANRAYEEGHEMASHANGHYDAGAEKWDYGDWLQELQQFKYLVFNLFSINRVSPDPAYQQGWLVRQQEVVGFRAPQLGLNSEMFRALRDEGYTYDTSRSSDSNYWPQKNSMGLWNFPLAELRIVGTGKRTLSMDYNFYVAQSGAVDKPENKERYKREMLDTYLKYFQDNYNGNRAPLHIGHHFSLWNGGAYWEAMKEFAEQVCGLPETHCVTYKEYQSWLDRLSAEDLAAYRKGQFEKSLPLKVLASNDNPRWKNLSVSVAMRDSNSLMVRPVVPNMADLKALSARFSVNGEMAETTELSLSALRSQYGLDSSVKVTAHVFNMDGTEVARATQKLEHLGTTQEKLNNDVFERRALMGDLPEAHRDERYIDFADLQSEESED